MAAARFFFVKFASDFYFPLVKYGKYVPTQAQSYEVLETGNLALRVIWANLVHLILRISGSLGYPLYRFRGSAVFLRVYLVTKSVAKFILRWLFFNKILNLNFALG
jgi:hypothetical protein